MMTEFDVGPIDYLALEFPTAQLKGEGFAILVDLVDRGIIRILDCRFAVKAEDGSFAAVAIADLDGDGTLDLAVFEGVESGLLDDDDLSQAVSLIEPGSGVALLVYENTLGRPVRLGHEAGRGRGHRQRPDPGRRRRRRTRRARAEQTA